MITLCCLVLESESGKSYYSLIWKVLLQQKCFITAKVSYYSQIPSAFKLLESKTYGYTLKIQVRNISKKDIRFIDSSEEIRDW